MAVQRRDGLGPAIIGGLAAGIVGGLALSIFMSINSAIEGRYFWAGTKLAAASLELVFFTFKEPVASTSLEIYLGF